MVRIKKKSDSKEVEDIQYMFCATTLQINV